MGQAYQPLHHKYRPQRFNQLVGQEAIAATLSNALTSGRIAPAYLLSGPRGTGKTSSARILARSLNCISSSGPTPEPCGSCELCTSIAAGNALDVIEIDAASNTGVDNIRELIERSRFAPVQARWKVYVIDECHMLSTAAFNALLKTLEEPPPRVVFVLATTDPQRVLPTILSRCQRFDFRRIPLEPLERHLAWIAAQEGIGITPEALHVVAQRAQGGLRDAESLLDQLSLLPAPVEAIAVWELLGAVPEQELLELARGLATADPLALSEACRQLLDRGREPAAVLQGIAAVLRDLVLAGVAPDRLELTSLSPQFRPQLPELARSIGKARLLLWQSQLKGSEFQLRQSVNPRLWLEVLLLGLLAEPIGAATGAVISSASQHPPVGTPAARPGGPDPATTAPRMPAAVTPAAGPAPVPAPAPAVAVAIAHAADLPSDRQQAESQQAEPRQADLGPAANLPELWQQILAGLELPSTRMLLSQQAQLVRLDERRAVVRVAGNWMAMVQSRLPLVEKAIALALGSSRQLVLEGGGEPSSPGLATPGPKPAGVPAPTSAPAMATPSGPPAAALAVTSATAVTAKSAVTATNGLPVAAPNVTQSPGSQQTPGPAQTGAPAMDPRLAEGRSSGQLDERTRRFAEFFNGEVVELDGPLDGALDDTLHNEQAA